MNASHSLSAGFDPTDTPPEGAERVRFDAAACLSRRFADYACELCADACPVAALGTSAAGPVWQDACLGCGQCAAACPSGALATIGFEPPTALGDGPEIFIDCWRVPAEASPDGALRVPCTGGIGLGWLLALCERADGRPVHLIDRGQCASCPAGKGQTALRARVAEARLLLFECGLAAEALPSIVFLPAAARYAPAIPAADAEIRLGRRAFFRGLLGAALRGAEEIATAGRRDEAEAIVLRGRIQPAERLYAMAALTAIARRHGRKLPARALPQLMLGACSGHGVCARVCPTEALVREEAAGIAELKYYAARCIACGQCARTCPDQAIHMQPEGGQATYEVLARWQARSCLVCGQEHYDGGGETCPACRKNQQLMQGVAALFGPRIC